MKSFLILLFTTLLFFLNANSQIVIFQTYEDYKNGVGEKYDSYRGYTSVLNNLKLNLVKDNKNVNVSCENMWGLTYNDVVFRIDNSSKPYQIARLIFNGKICYYENGYAHLEMIRDNKTTGDFSIGNLNSLSKDINSEICALPFNMAIELKRKYNAFKEEYPEYKSIFECIGKDFSQKNVLSCVQLFEKK